MAAVYILFSETLKRFYVGSCAELTDRLPQHLSKNFADSFTAKADDWKLFFTIDHLDYKQARSIEMHIKKMKSSIYIKNLYQHPAIAANLTEKYKIP